MLACVHGGRGGRLLVLVLVAVGDVGGLPRSGGAPDTRDLSIGSASAASTAALTEPSDQAAAAEPRLSGADPAAGGGAAPTSPTSDGSQSDAVVIEAPTTPEQCAAAGGQCLPQQECPNAEHGWNQPFKGVCQEEGHECCFKDIRQHRLRCGVFGGDCAPAASCGRAPRHAQAHCARSGDVCCIWLFK